MNNIFMLFFILYF